MAKIIGDHVKASAKTAVCLQHWQGYHYSRITTELQGTNTTRHIAGEPGEGQRQREKRDMQQRAKRKIKGCGRHKVDLKVN